MIPVAHEFGNKQRFCAAQINSESKTVLYNGSLVSDADTLKHRKALWLVI